MLDKLCGFTLQNYFCNRKRTLHTFRYTMETERERGREEGFVLFNDTVNWQVYQASMADRCLINFVDLLYKITFVTGSAHFIHSDTQWRQRERQGGRRG